MHTGRLADGNQRKVIAREPRIPCGSSYQIIQMVFNHMDYRVIYIGVRRDGTPDSKPSLLRPYGDKCFFFEYYNVFGTIWLTQLERGAYFYTPE